MTPKRGTRRGDEALLLALAEGSSWDDAAARAGVSRSTVARRMTDPGFRGKLADLRRAAIDGGASVLAANVVDAARKLADIALQPASVSVLPVHVRLRALGMLLDAAARYREVADLEDRILELEHRTGVKR